MKKQILFMVALALAFVACEQKVEITTIATFEEAAIAPAKTNSEYKLDTTGTFTSGSFIFQQDAQPSAFYYSGFVVSNHTDTTFVDYNDAWKSIAGGANRGSNYVVWNKDYYGHDTIFLKAPSIVPAMFVTNSVYTYHSMVYGDAYAGEPFGDDDYLTVTVTGYKDGKKTGTVDFDLARGKNILTYWTNIDLYALGEVDAITFDMTGSRTSYGYLDTPAYFCIDDLGLQQKECGTR